MDRESVDRLRFDRRLEQRHGWIEDSEKEAHLEALPDVSEKLTRGEEQNDEAGAEGGVAAETSAEGSSGVVDVPPVAVGIAPSGTFPGGGTELS